MTKVKNNLGRSLSLNLKKDKTLRLLPYETKEIDEKLISEEVKGNEREGYISLIKKEVKEVKVIEKKKGDK